MELFIDSADGEKVKKYCSLSIFSGITTTPTFFFRQGISDFREEIGKMSQITRGQIHVEALGESVDEIVENAKKTTQ